MTIIIEGYKFEGPFANTSHLKDASGVYVILGNNGGDKWEIVDVGESSYLRTRVDTHDRTSCWNNQKYKNLRVAAYYTNKNSRESLATKIRQKRKIPCGKR